MKKVTSFLLGSTLLLALAVMPAMAKKHHHKKHHHKRHEKTQKADDGKKN